MSDPSSINDIMCDSDKAYYAAFRGWTDEEHKARLRFSKVVEGNPLKAPDMDQALVAESPVLNVLGEAKDLKIKVQTGNDPVSLCAVQDLLFAFVDRIPSNHHLRSLEITITVVLPHDDNTRGMVVADVWPAPMIKQDIIHENKRIQPGDLSRMHMTAFLADPLKKLRKVGLAKKGGSGIDMYFPGRTGAVWDEILPRLTVMVRGKTNVKDYEVFKRYFEAMRHLIRPIKTAIKLVEQQPDPPADDPSYLPTPESQRQGSPEPEQREVVDLEDDEFPPIIDLTGDDEEAPAPAPSIGLPELRAIIQALGAARIRGDFEDLKEAHAELVQLANVVIAALSTTPPSSPPENPPSIIGRLEKAITYANQEFPRTTDVSHYGYNESDIAFALYKSDPKVYVPQLPPTRRQQRQMEHDERDARQQTEQRRPTRESRRL